MEAASMRTRTFAIALVLAPLWACTSSQTESSPEFDESDDEELELDADSIQTQDEADAQAAKEINADNADAELQKLIQEIDAPEDGG
jgi:hypothetical protein